MKCHFFCLVVMYFNYQYLTMQTNNSMSDSCLGHFSQPEFIQPHGLLVLGPLCKIFISGEPKIEPKGNSVKVKAQMFANKLAL